ncbi:MAG: hypothetical protein AAFR87_32525, partial [Bacteroidota bacterium]
FLANFLALIESFSRIFLSTADQSDSSLVFDSQEITSKRKVMKRNPIGPQLIERFERKIQSMLRN